VQLKQIRSLLASYLHSKNTEAGHEVARDLVRRRQACALLLPVSLLRLCPLVVSTRWSTARLWTTLFANCHVPGKAEDPTMHYPCLNQDGQSGLAGYMESANAGTAQVPSVCQEDKRKSLDAGRCLSNNPPPLIVRDNMFAWIGYRRNPLILLPAIASNTGSTNSKMLFIAIVHSPAT